MASGYTKEFLVNAFLSRFEDNKFISIEDYEALEKMANSYYDEVGRDKFRIYASLDAEAIRVYKNLT